MLCASCSSNKKKYVIGISQCSEDIWREKLNEELRMGTFLYEDVELKFASANDDDKRQIEQINAFVKEGVDLLIVSPNQINTVSKAIDNAYDNNIPVILFDRKTDSEKYTAFIGADNYAIGKTMASFIAAQLGGEGRVVEIMGLKGASPAIERHKGFVDELKTHPGIVLVDTEYSDWTEKSGQKAMDIILERTSDFDMVFGHNDRLADGARKSIESHGLTKPIRYVGVDALPVENGGMIAVKNNELAASYIYPTRGDLVIQLAINILEGKPFERENYLRTTIVTKDNVEAMLMQADEMNQQSKRLKELHAQVDRYLAQYNHQKIYLLLCSIIIALLAGFFIYVYRTIMMKRRLTEEAANAKLRFFTDVSHEFRTPLTLIADPIDRLLNESKIDENQRQLLSLVRKNVNILLKLVSEILDLRKIQNGKMKINVTRFDLASQMKDWFVTFMPITAKKKIELDIDIPDSLFVVSDYDKVERICYNLLSNAVKYTHEGGKIKLCLGVEDNKRFVIKVEDNGIGIPNDKIDNIFERFYQIKNSNTSGTGIGLALAKSFVELMGGNISVESHEGKGSLFTVILPLEIEGVEISNEEKESVKAEEIIPEKSFMPPTGNAELITNPDENVERKEILVVDDNEDVRNYISSLLTDNYKVTLASNGKEGLKRAIKEVPDLIICDVMMPVMDGLEMCRLVKEETITSHIPVLMLTAHTLEDQRTEGYECGADAYITKPFSGKVLLSRVKNLLNNRSRLKDIFSHGTVEETKESDSDSIFINQFREKVQQHLSDSELSVEVLSAEMGLSRVQLYRKVKALTGSTPVELIRITRLKRADRLLKKGGKTVSEISYEVGFSSPSYFIKCYKDYFGKTPNAKE